MAKSSTAAAADLMESIHPGEVLVEDFIEGFSITQNKLAVSIGVPPRRINEIVHGKRGDYRGHGPPPGTLFRDIGRVLAQSAEPLRVGLRKGSRWGTNRGNYSSCRCMIPEVHRATTPGDPRMQCSPALATSSVKDDDV